MPARAWNWLPGEALLSSDEVGACAFIAVTRLSVTVRFGVADPW